MAPLSLALAGSASVLFVGWGAIGPWPKSGSKTGINGCSAKAVKVRRLAGSSAEFGVGIKVGGCVAGPSGETWFLAYLLL